MNVPMKKTITEVKHVSNELIKVQTILNCTTPIIEMIHDYLEGLGTKNPAAVVYAGLVMDVWNKVSDAEEIIINMGNKGDK